MAARRALLLHPQGASQPGEARGRAPLPAGVSGASGRLRKEEKAPKKKRWEQLQRLRCPGSDAPREDPRSSGGRRALPSSCSPAAGLGFGFFLFFDSFLSLAATRPEISHRTRTALGELLPKGRGDTRATPRKKKIQRGRIQHGYLGTASVFQQAKAYAAFYRLLARHTEGEKAQVFLLLIYGSHLIKV